LTTSSRRPTPASRATRRSRRPASRQATFVERNRTRLLWIGGAAVFAVLLIFGFVLPALQPAYACGNLFDPTAAPSFVAQPTASPGSSSAPAATVSPPGYVQPDMGHLHAPIGEKVKYTWCPPASGRHYQLPAGPIKGGLYGPNDATIPEGWVHNLEHGAIVLLYRCRSGDEGCTDAGQAALKALLAKWPTSPICKLPPGPLTPVITRFDDMPYPYAALVWDVVLPLQAPDEQAIFDFYSGQAERFNPEKQCSAPTATPGPTGTPVPTSTPAASTPAASAPAASAPSGSAPAVTAAPSPS
jgi:hypothetical protein